MQNYEKKNEAIRNSAPPHLGRSRLRAGGQIVVASGLTDAIMQAARCIHNSINSEIHYEDANYTKRA